MPGKPRVHELAKELGVSSALILSELKALGEYVKSPSSTLEQPVVARLRLHLSEPMAANPQNEVLVKLRNLTKWEDVVAVIKGGRRAQREKSRLVLDLSGVQYSYPNACVPVAGLIQHYRSVAVEVVVTGLEGRVENLGIEQPLEATPENLSSHRVVNTIWAYFDPEQASALAQAVVGHLEKSTVMEPGVQDALNISLYEIIDNVLEHSEQTAGYFMFVMQAQATRLSLTVGDTGVGARESFRGSAHRPQNDFDALTLAVQAGVTGTGDKRGNGLFGLQRTVEKNGGSLQLRSGTGELTMRGDSVTGGDHASLPIVGPGHKGFFVDWQVDLNRAVSIKEVFGPLHDVEPRYTNTRLEAIENHAGECTVLMRDHDKGLGTRKAATELRNYLLNLINQGASPLVLDFDGVAVVSPSFADEVLGKLVEQFGVVRFMQAFSLRNMWSTVEFLVNRAISLRIATENPKAITREDSQPGQ